MYEKSPFYIRPNFWENYRNIHNLRTIYSNLKKKLRNSIGLINNDKCMMYVYVT